MPGKLVGKTVLVTGASKGIGAEIAKRLAAEGAVLAVHYASSRAGADGVVGAIVAAGGKAAAFQADMSNEVSIRGLFAEIKRTIGKLDGLVNNAGVYEFAPLEDVTVESFRRMFDLNVLGLLLATREFVAQLGPAGGNVVNISSIAATVAPATASVYAGTKAAVDAITRSLASELGPMKIRVNAVNPGLIETEGAHAQGIVDSEWRRQVEARTPLGRIGQPGDVAGLVGFLMSDDAAWITGETWHVAGGYR